MEKYVGCCIADLRYLGVSENRVPLIPLMKHNYLYQHCHFREYKPLSAAKRLFKLNCVLKLPLHQSLACPRLDLEKNTWTTTWRNHGKQLDTNKGQGMFGGIVFQHWQNRFVWKSMVSPNPLDYHWIFPLDCHLEIFRGIPYRYTQYRHSQQETVSP